ncbi:MAG: sigma-70 family RNA polymerase sigma factor, partial [Steroidobacteraceae bacterium]
MNAKSELTQYLNEVGRLPVLTREAQLRHCRRIHTWVNWPGGREHSPENVSRAGRRSMDVMVATNTRLVVSIARKYVGRGLDMLDLIQEGNLGLIRGLELYDPTRGYALSTYVYWWIRQSITRAIHVQARTIRIPINAHETLNRVQKFSVVFLNAHGRLPTTPEIAEGLQLALDRVHQLLEMTAITQCSSLDAPSTEEGNTILALIPNQQETASHNPETALLQGVDRDLLELAMNGLNGLERQVIEDNCLGDRSLRDIGEEVGLSR